MSLKSTDIKNDPYIHYNSLISLKLLSDHYHLKAKYLIRMENLEQTLLLKLCDSPLLEYSDLKESFFFIRDIDECQSIYGKNKSDDSHNSQYIQQYNLKESGFSNMDKITFNQTFFLQHMMSKKFITIEKLQGNDNYSLKLVVDVESAMSFEFKSINETHSSLEPLTFNNIFYLSVYNKEKGQFYFINHASFDKANLEKNEDDDNSDYENEPLTSKEKKTKLSKRNYSDLCLVNTANDKFSIINQSWYINKKDYLYSGQLINIIFSHTKNKKIEKMMLSAIGTKVEKKIEENIGIKEEIREDIDGMLRDNNQKYIQFYGTTDRIEEKKNSFSSISIKGLKHDDNLFEHVVNNSFWVIENETFKRKETGEREAIKIGDLVRIKNPLLGLYLKIKKKDKEKINNEILENNLSGKNVTTFNNIINNNNITNNNLEEDEYEFELVNEDVLNNYYYNYNFQFFHYNANEEEKQNMVADGKYVLKSVFRELNTHNSDKNLNKLKKVDFREIAYFEPIFLNMKNENDISIKIEDDYILEIKKIDINDGNEAIYMQNIISELNFILKSYKKKKTSSNSVIKKITQYINFFMDYLLNINYTFKDDNYEINHPIENRQLLLDKYNILDTILEIINYFLPTVKDIKLRDSIIRSRSKKKTNIYNNNSRINDVKDTLQIGNDNGDNDSAISNMKSLLKLILKFLIHLSENKEDIKQKIFENISPILVFSEHIHSKEKSVLLDFIFDILKDSESLQECIVTGKLKLSKNNKNKNFRPDLSIDKILIYIETTYNYLYYYKKLMHLKKIKYKMEEIKEKIKLHMKKVKRDFKNIKKIKMNINSKKEIPNNYKEIIYLTMKNIKSSAIEQIRELNNYLEHKNENDKKPTVKRGKTNVFSKKENNDMKNDMKNTLKYKSEKKVNFAINVIKENSSSSSSIIKKNTKKIDVNEINNNEDNYGAESNDYLNNRSPVKSKQSDILNKSPYKKSVLFESSKNNINLANRPNIEIDNNQDNDISNLYSVKNIDDDFEAYAIKRISDLKIILGFIKYFKSIKLNKILFIKDQFFQDIFGKDIKEEFLENNLNFVINGDSTSINFINGVEYNSKSLLGPLFPLRLFNIFFPTLDNNSKMFETKYYIEEIEEDESDEESSESEDDASIVQKNKLNQNYFSKKKLIFEHDDNNEEESESESESNNKFSKEINLSDMSEKEEKEISSPESPSEKKDNEFNFSIKNKEQNKEKNKKILKDKKVGIEKQNTLRKSTKHQTINAIPKGVMFKSKVIKFFNYDKKNETQKIIEKCKEFEQDISKSLYILYSIYFFCINEYMEIVYKTFTIIFNYSINYEYFTSINSVKIALNFIKENLLPRVIFINNNNAIKNIYDKIKINTSLLNDTFNIENFYGNENKNDSINFNEHDNEDENDSINPNNNENRNKNRKNQFNKINGKDFNNKDNKLFFGNESTKLKVLTSEEIILVDFLIYFCKKNDQINYILEKIEHFKNLKKFINDSVSQDNEENEEIKINQSILKIFVKTRIMKKNTNEINEEKQIKKKFQKILKVLIKKRNDILILYEKLFEVKNKFLFNNSLSSCNYDDYGIGKQANFMIKLLEQYEIENYFNKIIYLEVNNNNSLIDKNAFEKLMNIQEVFKIIEREIQIIKEEFEINNFRDDTSFAPSKLPWNKNNENHYKNLNNKLKSITKKNLLNIYSMKELNKEEDIKFIEMLIKENENFFDKIGFTNSLKIMVEFIKKYDEYKKKNNEENEENYILQLNYCKEILRVFIDVQSVFPKFYKSVPDNYEIYISMIVNCLGCIKDSKGNETSTENEEKEKLFLCICYYSSESFLFLLKYCKKQFSDRKTIKEDEKKNKKEEEFNDFMKQVFDKLKDIYNIYHNPKNKVIFQLFYNYLITRVLILLNKEQNYDSYENFLNSIYPYNPKDNKEVDMKKRVFECINELQKNEDYSNTKEMNPEEEDEEESEDKKINENNNDEEENEDEDKSNWKNKCYSSIGKNTDSSNSSVDKSSNEDKGKDKNEEKKFSNGELGLIFNSKKEKNIWEDDEEREKLSFLLYFSSSYIIYLKDKKLGKIKEFLNFGKDKPESYLDKNNYDNKKNDSSMQSIRNSSLMNQRATFTKRQFEDNNNISINNTNNNIFDNDKNNKKKLGNITYITNNYKSTNDFQKHENKLNFELILFESISIYKLIKEKKIEIPIRKMTNEYEQGLSNNDSNNYSNKSKESKEEEINKKKDSRLITFYYYEPKALDIILLEKIFKDVEIKKNLKYYCTNCYTNEDYESLDKSKLLIKILELQNKYENITYQDKEYNILKEQFIKNDMEKFIKSLLKKFNENDLNTIYKMQDYIYNIMNEIYPHESLYYNNQSEMIKSLIETLKGWEEEVQRQDLKIDNEKLKKEKTIIDKSITHLEQIDLFNFFNSLIYLNPKYDKKICLIFYRIAFQLLYAKCSPSDSQSNKNNNEKIYSVLNGIILLFTRKINHSLIESKIIFSTMVNSIKLFLKKIQENDIFISENYDLIQELFHKLDFVLDHLSKDFDKIFNFMKSPESQQITTKYKNEKMENSLNDLITFMITLIGFKKKHKTILTKEINEFSQKIVKKIITLISILLQKSQETSFKSIDLLLNFIYYFIDGPDKDNLNTLFNCGYYELVSHVIKNIDYYSLFLSNINKENLNEIIDNIIEIECRIIKIFFIYYNIRHHEYKKIEEFRELRKWYDENILSIKNKLKKVYYLSKKEMENMEYDIDKMLLSLKENDDSYSDEELLERAKYEYNVENIENLNDSKKMFEDNKKGNDNKINNEIIEENDSNNNKLNNENENENNKIKFGNSIGPNLKVKENENVKNKKNNYCLIKFDLLLIYYTLYNYHQDSLNEGFLSVPPKKTLLRGIISFFKECYNFIINVILLFYKIPDYIYRHYAIKKKSKIELLQELSDIDKKCLSIDENEMFRFLASRIKCVEVSLNYILYKLYFPLLNKAKQIQNNSELYLKIDNTQLSNFVTFILSSYDKINIIATQDLKIDKIIEFPILNIIFKNNNLYSTLLIITSLIVNLLIMLSYSTFTTKCNKSQKDPSLDCPHLLYNNDNKQETIEYFFDFSGCLLLLLQAFLFLGYIWRRYAQSYGLYKIDYKKKQLLKLRSGGKCSYFFYFIPKLIKIIINFQTIYYILSLTFIIFGLKIHKFFYCFSLLELVNTVDIMQVVLKAMYVPLGNILITLLMFIMLEYVFSMFALTVFTKHFPIESDTKRFLWTFMRMLDQTFKQDGGIGTYLDQTKDRDYEPYTAKSYVGGRFFFDLSFFLLVNTLIFQMFLSMIIDYFTTTKENKEDFQKLAESQCLICRLEREDLEKLYSNLKNAFDLHVNHYHSLIDYISYLVFLQALKKKDPIIDEGVWKLHLSNIFKYLPKGTCFKKIENNRKKYEESI